MVYFNIRTTRTIYVRRCSIDNDADDKKNNIIITLSLSAHGRRPNDTKHWHDAVLPTLSASLMHYLRIRFVYARHRFLKYYAFNSIVDLYRELL